MALQYGSSLPHPLARIALHRLQSANYAALAECRPGQPAHFGRKSTFAEPSHNRPPSLRHQYADRPDSGSRTSGKVMIRHFWPRRNSHVRPLLGLDPLHDAPDEQVMAHAQPGARGEPGLGPSQTPRLRAAALTPSRAAPAASAS